MRTIKHLLCIALALLIAAKITNTVYQGSTDKTEAPGRCPPRPPRWICSRA